MGATRTAMWTARLVAFAFAFCRSAVGCRSDASPGLVLRLVTLESERGVDRGAGCVGGALAVPTFLCHCLVPTALCPALCASSCCLGYGHLVCWCSCVAPARLFAGFSVSFAFGSVVSVVVLSFSFLAFDCAPVSMTSLLV